MRLASEGRTLWTDDDDVKVAEVVIVRDSLDPWCGIGHEPLGFLRRTPS
jgi:hypothetical protein